MGMMIWKTPKPTAYSYSLGTGCCNLAKEHSKCFLVDDEGNVYWQVWVAGQYENTGRDKLLKSIKWDHCPFCGEPFEVADPKDYSK